MVYKDINISHDKEDYFIKLKGKNELLYKNF